ncbi:MAG: DUF4384 domain-containing protein [Myxococcaceae bacterium]|nr:DUF4384 domain-containing protein [Myxococcaceae bacterium]
MTPSTPKHLSSETIDLLSLAALEPAQARSARAHIDSCSQCQAEWQTLQEDKARFEQFVLPRTLPKIEATLAPVPWTTQLTQKWKLLIPAASLAGVAVLALVLTPQATDTPAYVGVKGPSVPTFDVVAQRPSGGQFTVTVRTPLKPKDRIRFVVDPATANYLMIASQDAAGVFTVFYPYGGQQSAAVRRGEVPGSIELDATVGPETLVAVFSLAPVTAQTVKNALTANPTAPRVENAHVLLLPVMKESL